LTASVVHALAGVAREAAHLAVPRRSCGACGRPEAVLADRDDAAVVRHGVAVAKAHADDTDPGPHRARLAVAGHPLLAGILLAPLLTTAGELYGRPVSAWPYGMPVDPDDPDAAPWEEAGILCARLHAVPVASLPGPLPAMRGPAKAARAVARMRALGHRPEAVPVLRAWERLPAWARGEARSPGPGALCHGDLHLGQLVRHPASPAGSWLLIDVDDLGLGEPAWDLARPAAWYAAGLLAPETWQRFLGAYRSAGGPAVPAEGDPWPQLDVAARALTVQSAALALVRSAREEREPDEVEQLMIDACSRIASLPQELGPGAPT
jgi:hypothetical protein